MQNAKVLQTWTQKQAEDYSELLKELYLENLLKDPDGIGNMDESYIRRSGHQSGLTLNGPVRLCV